MASRSLHSRSRAWTGPPPPPRRPLPSPSPTFSGDDDESEEGEIELEKDTGDDNPYSYGIQVRDALTGDDIWYDITQWDDAEDAEEEITADLGAPGWRVIDADEEFLAPDPEIHNDNFKSIFNQYQVYEKFGDDGFAFAKCFDLDTSGAWDFDDLYEQWHDRYFCESGDMEEQVKEDLLESGDEIPPNIFKFIDFGRMAEDLLAKDYLECGEKIFWKH